MRDERRLFGLLVCALLAAAALAAGAEDVKPAEVALTGPRAFILDGEAKGLVLLDAPTGKVIATIPLPGEEPQAMKMTSNGNRLVILHGLSGKATTRGFHPSSRSMISIVDTRSRAVVRQVTLGWNWSHVTGMGQRGFMTTAAKWGLDDVEISPDGKRLAVICPGFDAARPEERLPRELLIVDLESGASLPPIPLGGPSSEAALGGFFHRRSVGQPLEARAVISWTSGRAAVLETSPSITNAAPTWRLRIVDMATGGTIASRNIDGFVRAMETDPSGELLYVLSTDALPEAFGKGSPTRGRLLVVATTNGEARPEVGLGTSPRGLAVDGPTGRVLLLSDAPAAKDARPEGQLHVVKDGKVERTVPVSPSPSFLLLSEDRRTLAVVGKEETRFFGYPELVLMSTSPLSPLSTDAPGSFLNVLGKSKHAVEDMVVVSCAPHGQRAIASYASAGKVSAVDVGSGKVLFTKSISRVAEDYASPAKRAEQENSRQFPERRRELVPAGTSPCAEGTKLFVPDPLDNRVHALDPTTGEVVAVLKAGRPMFPLRWLPNATLVVPGGLEIAFIDARANAVAARWKGSVVDLATAKSETQLIVVGSKEVTCLDGQTGKQLSVAKLRKPIQALFESSAR